MIDVRCSSFAPLRLPRTIRASVALCLLFALSACSTIPRIDGKEATEFTVGQVLDAGEAALRDGDPVQAAALGEFVLRNHFDDARREDARWLAAEGRFQHGDYSDALIHYRRLVEDDPTSPKIPQVPDRLWTMGKTLIREQSARFADLSSRHDIGVEALNLLVTQYPQHEYADDSWRELAIAFQNDGLYQAAADCFEKLAREFPDGEWADYALYHVAAEYREMSRGHEYDVEPLFVAYGALGRYLEAFPQGNFAAAAATERREIESEVTRRELKIAEYYRFRGSPEGERLHLANAARRFPEAPEAKDAAARLEAAGVKVPDSLDLLSPRVDRPRWEAGSQKDVIESRPHPGDH